MNIRSFKSEDASDLAQIFHEAVHAIGKNHYSQEQLNAWSSAPVSAKQFHTRVSDGRSVFVATNESDRGTAFIELEPDGHIDCFYCHPNVAGTGVAKAFYDHLEKSARTHALPRLYVEASEAARRFFLRAGFNELHRRDFKHRGIALHNYAMEKVLN